MGDRLAGALAVGGSVTADLCCSGQLYEVGLQLSHAATQSVWKQSVLSKVARVGAYSCVREGCTR